MGSALLPETVPSAAHKEPEYTEPQFARAWAAESPVLGWGTNGAHPVVAPAPYSMGRWGGRPGSRADHLVQGVGAESAGGLCCCSVQA